MTSTNSWHIAQWPPLAWLETGLKLVALWIGVATAVSVFTTLPAAHTVCAYAGLCGRLWASAAPGSDGQLIVTPI